MKFLMRHQTCPPRADVEDHDRPLDAVGRAEAMAMGHHFRDLGFEVKRIVHSSALRTTQTAQCFIDGYGDLPFESKPELYNCDPETLLGTVADGTLVVAHNPAIEVIVSQELGAFTAVAPGTVFVVDTKEVISP